jgi:hypothetical protein
MTENWRRIKDFEHYLISDQGRVYSNRSKIFRVLSLDKDGYPYVILHDCDRHLKKFTHALVLENFIGPRPDGMVARHYPDQDKTNNNLLNLSWDTPAVNARDRYDNFHANTVLIENDIIDIKDKLLSGDYTQADIHREYNISRQCVLDIITNKSWENIGPDVSDFNFDKRRILTILEVSQIKNYQSKNVNTQSIKKYYKISDSMISRIKYKKAHANVLPCEDKNLPTDFILIDDNLPRKIQKSEYQIIYDLFNSGVSKAQIARDYLVANKTIATIIKKF